MTSKTFTSPINLDDGEKHQFIGNADSLMGFVLMSPGGNGIDGYISWRYTFIDGKHKGKTEYKAIRLWFNKKRLVAFDGVFELPDEAIALLEQNGYDATYAKSI